MFSRLLQHPGVEMEWDYSGRMGRDEKQEDRWSMNKKEKKGKDREKVGKWRDKGGDCPRPTQGDLAKVSLLPTNIYLYLSQQYTKLGTKELYYKSHHTTGQYHVVNALRNFGKQCWQGYHQWILQKYRRSPKRYVISVKKTGPPLCNR